MTTVIFNGNAYSDDGSASRDMQNGGFRIWLLAMIRDQMVEVRAAPAQSAAAAEAALQAQIAAAQYSDAAMGFRNETRAARDTTLIARDQAVPAAAQAVAAAGTAQQAAATATAVGPGWTPVLALQPADLKVVARVVDFVGGLGNKPTGYIGKYLGPAGYVDDVASAQDVRGPRGEGGSGAMGHIEPPAAGVSALPAGDRDGDYLVLNGYGMYVWSATSTEVVDRETVIGTAAGGPGRWLLRLPAWDFIWSHIAPQLTELQAKHEALRRFIKTTTSMRADAVLDFPAIAANSRASLTVALPGASLGAVVAVGVQSTLHAGLIPVARVWEAGVVLITLHNTTTAAIDPAPMNYTVHIIQGGS